jgi:uncharacterized Zn finger protein (UPF0148 family)
VYFFERSRSVLQHFSLQFIAQVKHFDYNKTFTVHCTNCTRIHRLALHTMSTPQEESRNENERKMEIARKLAASMMATSSETQRHENSIKLENNLKLQQDHLLRTEILTKRMRKTLKLIDSAKSNSVYSMTIEKKLITESNMELLLNELNKLDGLDCIRMSSLIRILTEHLQV